jgi:hypothetical protein
LLRTDAGPLELDADGMGTRQSRERRRRMRRQGHRALAAVEAGTSGTVRRKAGEEKEVN